MPAADWTSCHRTSLAGWIQYHHLRRCGWPRRCCRPDDLRHVQYAVVECLAGTLDPVTAQDACPVQQGSNNGSDGANSDTGITGMIPICPNYESDGMTLSPLAGQARGQHATRPLRHRGHTRQRTGLQGAKSGSKPIPWTWQKAHDAFLRVSEPSYFQEYGPAGYHVTIGFANPKLINARERDHLRRQGSTCSNSITGKVTTVRMSRPPDERLYSSGSRDSFGFTQCYVSLGDTRRRRFRVHQVRRGWHLHVHGYSRLGTGDSPSSTSGTIRSWTAFRRPLRVIGGQNLNMGDRHGRAVAYEYLHPDVL